MHGMTSPSRERVETSTSTHDIDREIGRRVAHELHARGHSQEEAAAAAGMTHRTLCRTLTGERSFLVEELAALTEYAGIDVAQVLRPEAAVPCASTPDVC